MLESGNRLGAYEIVAVIGAGGMGEVNKAKDTRLDLIVAIKVLPSHVSDDLPSANASNVRRARSLR
jgi:eukaryotic-like serine/threonine-protein kinase